MRAPDLVPLLRGEGPFLSLVMTTDAQIDNAAQRNELRWRGVRDELAAQGADAALLDAVGGLVPDAHRLGQTLVVVADRHGNGHVSHWPDPPVRELARWAPLPSLAPVLERRQAAPTHVIVVADRGGADLVAVRHEQPIIEREVQGGDVIRKINAGGWSQRRYQERAENSWDENAKAIAEQVAALVERVGARLVLVAGDVRAVQLLRDELPKEVAELVEEVAGSRGTDGSPGVDPGAVARAVGEAAARETQVLEAKLAEELGQGDRACAGVTGTLTALAAAQVQALLVHDDPDDERTAWFGPEPALVAASEDDLRGMGVERCQQGRLADVAIRAALGTDAGVRMLHSPAEVTGGIAAILRWS